MSDDGAPTSPSPVAAHIDPGWGSRPADRSVRGCEFRSCRAHRGLEWIHTMAVAQVAKLYDCSGTNYFEPDPAAPQTATRVRLTGNLVVHADAVPGVPAFLGRRIAPEIEGFIIGMIKPNLSSLAAGLQRYLDAQSR